MSRVLLAALAAISWAGCHWSLNDPGTDPITAQFYFPSGMAIDQAHGTMFVTNANADLRFGGGTVMAVDLQRFDRALGDFASHTPNADAAMCLSDPLDPRVVDCDETPFIFGASAPGDQTVKVGNFAGDIRILPNPDGSVRLFVGVRGDPSITWIDVRWDQNGKPLLDCFDEGAQVARGLPHQPAPCDGTHLVQQFFDPSLLCPNANGQQPPPATCPQQFSQLPPEPFGMVLDTAPFTDGNATPRLVVSHLGGGNVSILDVGATPPQILSVSQPFFAADAAGHHGAYGIAKRERSNPLSLWYLTSEVSQSVQMFRVAEAGVAVPSSSFSLGGVFGAGNDGRQIFFQHDGNRAFMTENNPPTVLVIDTSLTPPNDPLGINTVGMPANQVTGIIDVCQNPSHILVCGQGASDPNDPTIPCADPSAATRLYVACFLSNQVMVVDPDRKEVLDTILLGRGPTQIAYWAPSAPTLLADGRVLAERAYVTNFGEWTISMIDLHPGSPTENRVIARIGLPVAPQVP